MIKTYIGLPGCGKTSHAVKMAIRKRKKYQHIYANFPCPYSIQFDSKDLGYYDFSNSLILIDESGIDFNNRFYKGLAKETIQFLKLHRHYHCDIIVYSQALDFDITFRRLSSKLYIMKKRLFDCSLILPLKAYWDVDTEGQPIIKYKLPHPVVVFLFKPFFLFWRRPYYKKFNSYDSPQLPQYKDAT